MTKDAIHPDVIASVDPSRESHITPEIDWWRRATEPHPVVRRPSPRPWPMSHAIDIRVVTDEQPAGYVGRHRRSYLTGGA